MPAFGCILIRSSSDWPPSVFLYLIFISVNFFLRALPAVRVMGTPRQFGSVDCKLIETNVSTVLFLFSTSLRYPSYCPLFTHSLFFISQTTLSCFNALYLK